MTNHTITHDDRAGYLRCLIYDLYVLASAVSEMKETDNYALTEVYKTAAQLKLRAVHDFFFRPKAQDSIKLNMFDCYGPMKPKKNPLNKNAWLTLQSIQTYVVHLDKARVTKKYEKDDKLSGAKKGDNLPQPKFDKGNQSVIDASKKLMEQAKEFVESVLKHKDFPGIDRKFGKRWWIGFQEKLYEVSQKTEL